MKLNYKVYGSGPPLIICHGLFGMLDNWQTLAKKWADHYSVYIVDQRNHGKSPHTEDFSYALLAEDLSVFMEEQWIHEAFLLGHSMGGKTVMQLAMDFPDLVEKLVVVDMSPEANEGGHEQIFEAMRTLPVKTVESRKAAEEHLAKYISIPGVRQFLMKNLSREKSGGFRWKMNLESLYQNYDNILAELPFEEFAGPTLFLKGERSDYLAESLEEATVRRFPAAKQIIIPDAGHWVHADQPELLYQTVLNFLENPA